MVGSSVSELMEKHGVVITGGIQEVYIKLMCEYAPERVYRYLVSNEDYRLDYCLQLVQSYNIADATAYLLERTGDVPAALDLILKSVDQKISILSASFGAATPKAQVERLEKEVEQVVVVAISLCQRTSPTLDARESETLWFRLMDKLVHPLRKLKFRGRRKRDLAHIQDEVQSTPETKKVKQSLTNMIRMVLHSMMGYVSLPSLMLKIVRDHGGDEFQDFKAIILDMMDTFSYEKGIFETANVLFQNDIYSAMRALVTTRKRAYTTKSLKCSICSIGILGQQGGEVLIFPCGHSSHLDCLDVSKVCLICNTDDSSGKSGEKAPRQKRAQTQTNKASSASEEASRLAMFQNIQKSKDQGTLYKQQRTPPPLPQKKIINQRMPGTLPPTPIFRGGISDEQFVSVFRFR
eukprot:TRINITY_DN2219_c0_g1_i1.p1 TRINITY_DN2219_c0_g1~~TRINITY_DN2219_c0_g1_i1.p1  ORF type:complete len:407 (-),score=89.34 TRINITY_DN2219_c0_g1_i1:42-1262(-)